MASSNPRARLRATVGAAAVLACASAAVPAGPADQPINLEAASSDFDYKNGELTFKRVKITQGQIEIYADEANATGLNFDDSKWKLHGSVRIEVPEGRLESNDAVVQFRSNAVVSAHITGSPAQFQQRLKDTRQLAQGHAATIDYDVRGNTVRLTGAAWLSDGQNEIRGNTLIYDVAQQRVKANPGQTESGGVKITINPGKPAPGGDNGKNPSP